MDAGWMEGVRAPSRVRHCRTVTTGPDKSLPGGNGPGGTAEQDRHRKCPREDACEAVSG